MVFLAIRFESILLLLALLSVVVVLFGCGISQGMLLGPPLVNKLKINRLNVGCSMAKQCKQQQQQQQAAKSKPSLCFPALSR